MENMLDVIQGRRTARKFNGRSVDQDKIDALLELAMYAPSRLNRQPWRFVVIRDQALQKQLADLLRIHPYLETASAVIAVCSIPKLSPTWLMDTSAAIENMLIGATAMGIGTAWVGAPDTVMWDMCEEALHDALEIPLDVRIVALVAVGYPERELKPHSRQDRFDTLKVHYGRWGSKDVDEG
jgi:nitroreductase